MNKNEKWNVITPLAVLSAITLLILAALNFLVNRHNTLLSDIIIAVLIIYILFTSITLYSVTVFMNKGKVSVIMIKTAYIYLRIHMPMIFFIGRIFNIDIDFVRRIFIGINNFLVKRKNYSLSSEDIMILIPHCVQNSECSIKISNDIRECLQCGKCRIGDLKELDEKEKTSVFVATGGTLARKILKENRPKAVIAVACERDLTSGIIDMSGKLPVIGILNERPFGPCRNTDIDIDSIKNEIEFLKGNLSNGKYNVH